MLAGWDEGTGVTSVAPWYILGGPCGCVPGSSVGVHGRAGAFCCGVPIRFLGCCPAYCCALCWAAELCVCRLVNVEVPAIPDAAYRASMSELGC